MPDMAGALPGAGGAPPGATPGAAPSPGNAPTGSPMLTAQKPEGQKAHGKVLVMVAIHTLQLAMMALGVETPEGQAALDAVAKLTKKFGKSEEDSKQLMPAEIMQVLQGAAGPGAPPGGAAPPAAGAGPAAAAPPPGGMPTIQ